MAAYINISLQGTVYFAAQRSGEDERMLQLYSNKLVGVERESTFDALYLRVAKEWHQQDDLVNPFHDCRCIHIAAVWTFDLDGDILRFDTKHQNLWIPLHLVRQRPITIPDFSPYEPPIVPRHTLQSASLSPSCTITRKGVNLHCLERHRAFLSRVLADFAFQWRHILCGRYNNSTFRRLATAIIKIITLDFVVKEETQSRHGIGGFLVDIHNLPEWDPLSGHIVKAGGVSIVICQQMPHAIRLIREDFRKMRLYESLTYLILSVQEIALCRVNLECEIYTKPERLFDGRHPPSDEAIELLLEATQSRAPTTSITKLPVELQDMILDKVSAGLIESARVGCIFNAGSVFDWQRGGRDINREEGRTARTPWSPVESHIWFGDYSSGLAYK